MNIFIDLRNFSLSIFLFLFPFFFLNTTREIYETNKLYLLAFGAIILLLFSTIHLLSSKKIVYKKNNLDLPVILFVLTTVISIIISSPNKVQALLNPDFGLLSILSLTIVYFYISRIYGGRRGERVPTARSRGVFFEASTGGNESETGPAINSSLIISSLLLSFITIILFFQPLKNLSLPQNLEFLKSPSFTPLGSPLDLAIFLGFFTILGLTRILKRINTDDTKYQILNTMYFLVPLIALTLTIYNIIKPASANSNQFQLIILPFRYSWYSAIETLKNPLTALFGVGVDNFPSIFTKVKDINYNLSSYWNINSFSTSGSTILHILTETGLFGLTAFSLIILTLFNTIFADKKLTHTDSNYHLPSIIYLLIILLLFPPSLPVFFLFYLTLALIKPPRLADGPFHKTSEVINNIAGGERRGAPTSRTWSLVSEAGAGARRAPRYLIAVLFIILIIPSGYFLTRSYTAEYYFKKSLDGYQKNNLKLLYDNQKKTISLNPYIERFRLNFSQTNLILANNFAAKADKMTEQDKQSFIQAVKAAIDEAKAATTLNPQKAGNWENLANIYRNIVGLVQGADVWTISAYQRAIALDPQNPNYRLNLGGIYYAYGKYDDANRFFEQTVDLKPNLANAYYNLAWSSYKKGDYKKAVNSMQNALTLVNPNTAKADYEKAKSELEEFKKMLPEDETATESDVTNKPELNLPSLAPTQPQSIIEISP